MWCGRKNVRFFSYGLKVLIYFYKFIIGFSFL
eukprot:SAG11_NODE_52_length_19809_cov_14.064231_11_plen_32_part_00